MEIIQNNTMLEFHPDTIEVVRGMYDLNKPGAMDSAIDILDEWIKQQNHFTKKNFRRDFLERMIISTKGSVERAKARIDKLFTIKTLMPLFFKNCDPRYDFENIKDILNVVLLPKMTEDHDRIFICKVQGKKFTSALYLDCYKYILLFAEYARIRDYANSYHLIIDYMDASMPELISALDFSQLRQGVTSLMEGYGFRVKGVHILLDSKFAEIVISIAKKVVSAKIGKRIFCHRNYETLWQHVPKDMFPEEYGGKLGSIKDIHAKWMEVLSTEEYRRYLEEMYSAKTDESLRAIDKFNDQCMGLPGTFRTLTVD